jgi:2-polyprenyl-6-methoxyphenol hydroxylase-like FAD-dependent oxidoreductase
VIWTTLRIARFEREASTSDHSRAPGIHIRTREVLQQWGILDRFLEAGVLRRDLPLHDMLPYRPVLLDIGRHALGTH